MTATLTPQRADDDAHATGPRAGALALAARNAWALTPFGGGIEQPAPLPSTVVHDSPHCTVRRYSSPGADGTPVLLVPPLAVSIDCYDLRPGQSLAAHFVASGRPVYVVDYGGIRYADRDMGFDDWFARIIPTAVGAVLRDAAAGETAASADLVAWSLGGTLSLLTAAHCPELPIRSIVAMGTPIDYAKNPSIAPLRALGSLAPLPVVGGVVRTAGGIPSPLVRLSYRSTALTRELTRPWFIANNLTDTTALAQMEAIDRFMAGMPGYPARFYTQMHKKLIMGNALASGSVRMGGHPIELGDVQVPVLAVSGATDVLAPAASVAAITDVLTGSPRVQVETVPGSHLGMVAGSGARAHTWPVIDRFHAELGGR
ncbi:alpha/beta hydrolase [Tomitella fengzijianii]|uniref:Alpha/beta hydrolase n=1 Tax=Tomitella fengzijianii TaxID=2597660 RepID=A0A516X5R8_9ACTN|nr:alpha/beta hydrolase [Tomitella fengzijianii]QDQ98390.1 alpha/beta hydrolase [Tomitella fengzijianii]